MCLIKVCLVSTLSTFAGDQVPQSNVQSEAGGRLTFSFSKLYTQTPQEVQHSCPGLHITKNLSQSLYAIYLNH